MSIDPAIWIWGALAIAVVTAFYHKSKATVIFVAIALISALSQQRLSIVGFTSVLIGFAIAYQTQKQTGWLRYAGLTFVMLWSLALFLHFIPGFDNLKVLDNVYASSHSTSFTMYLNLDKPLAFFGLLLAYPALLGTSKKTNTRAIIATIIPLFVLLPIAAILGALKPEFSVPSWLWLFMLNNLLFTCVAEEAFFRGIVQQGVSQRFGWIFGLAVASCLFGLAHFAGGTLLVIFAGLAGIGYGLIFHLTGRLWAAVLVHFLFNLAHLLFFTYPMLER